MTVAVVLATYNRNQRTLDCLSSLFAQRNLGHRLTVTLYDDNSPDGTADLVVQYFPDVDVISGSGDAFWAGGMRAAIDRVLQSSPDHVLWLNDDVLLFPTAVDALVSTYEELAVRNPLTIVVGSLSDPETGELTYGGVRARSAIRGPLFTLVEPSDGAVQCDTMNGNCVLVPLGVLKRLGNLSPVFTHAIADYDYGLRAKVNGVDVALAPGYLGTCARNQPAGAWYDPELSLIARYRKLSSPKGLPPGEWRAFLKEHRGPTWWVFYLKIWMRLLLPRQSATIRRMLYREVGDR